MDSLRPLYQERPQGEPLEGESHSPAQHQHLVNPHPAQPTLPPQHAYYDPTRFHYVGMPPNHQQPGPDHHMHHHYYVPHKNRAERPTHVDPVWPSPAINDVYLHVDPATVDFHMNTTGPPLGSTGNPPTGYLPIATSMTNFQSANTSGDSTRSDDKYMQIGVVSQPIRDQRDVVACFSSSAMESWTGRSPRILRGKALSHHGSPGTTTPLTHIYSPPSQPIPLSSEGIVVQALNVVSDPGAGHFLANMEPNLKKISKRRKKTNGEVDVEHTKSNNELLRKLQHSLRHDPQCDSDEESPGEPESSTGSEEPMPGSPMLLQPACHEPTDTFKRCDEESITSKTTISTVNSDGVSLKGEPNETHAAGNLYGYEDPEQVIASIQVRRIPRVARRRGSVTEHTIRAAQRAVAFDAANRAKQMHMSHPSLYSVLDASSDAAAAAERLQNIRIMARQSWQARFEKTERDSSNTPMQEANQSRESFSEEARTVSTAVGTTRVGELDGGRMQTSDARGKDHDETSLYGYENPDDLSKQGNSDNSKNNPYDYGDATPIGRNEVKARPRARRRGSVTKYSLDTAKISAALATLEQFRAAPPTDTEYKPVLPIGIRKVEESFSPQSAFPVPVHPAREAMPMPWQAHNSPFVARKSALARKSRKQEASMVPVPSRVVPYRTPSGRSTPHDSSDEDDNVSIGSSSSDDTLDDSVTSITIPLKSGDSMRDGPMRPPSRHDSVRSFASRGSTHSTHTFDSSDGDSLAPDMTSLCSISHRESNAGMAFSQSDPVPPPPAYLPQTPTPGTQSRKFLPSTGSVQTRHAKAHHNGDSESLIFFDDTSPLPSPPTQVSSFLTDRLSLQGQMPHQMDLPTPPIEGLQPGSHESEF